MKKPGSFFRGCEGTIMVFALVIILGGALVLAGWAQMMATRAAYTVTTEEGQKRRIAIANGRALARQYVLNQMPSGNIGTALQGTNFSLTNGWGGFSINYATALWTNTNFVDGNPFNPISEPSFVVTNLATISNSAEALNWTFLIRSRSPVLAGYPLVVQNPAATNLAWASTLAKKIYWSDALGFTNAPAIPLTSGTNSSGLGTNGYIGYFASPMSTNYTYSAAAVSYPTNTFSTNTAVFTPPASTNGTIITRYFNGGSVSVSINATQSGTIVRYEVPNSLTNMFTFTSLVTNSTITTNTVVVTNTTVVITGTNITGSGKHTHTNYTYETNFTYSTNTVSVTNTSTNTYIDNYTNSSPTNVMISASTQTNTLHVIVASSNTNLSTITLSGTNNSRMVYLNDAGSSVTLQTATANENYTWRMGMTVSGFPASFTVLAPTNTRSLTLQGGIRANRNINLNQGNLTLSSNSVPAITGTDAASVELIGDRILWLEDQRSP